jgi:hypothetical protein
MLDDANRAMTPLRPTVSTDKKNQALAPADATDKPNAVASAIDSPARSGRN